MVLEINLIDSIIEIIGIFLVAEAMFFSFITTISLKKYSRKFQYYIDRVNPDDINDQQFKIEAIKIHKDKTETAREEVYKRVEIFKTITMYIAIFFISIAFIFIILNTISFISHQKLKSFANILFIKTYWFLLIYIVCFIIRFIFYNCKVPKYFKKKISILEESWENTDELIKRTKKSTQDLKPR